MMLSARSRNIDGPWEWSPSNPIVHTESKTEKWWSKGHGRLVDAADGSWWMTLHAYQNGLQTLGRQILLLPINWTADGWYKVQKGVSGGDPIAKAQLQPEPEFDRDPGFSGRPLDLQGQFWKGYEANRASLVDGALILTAHGESIQTTSALTRAATDRTPFEVEVEISPGCEAGLLLFYTATTAVLCASPRIRIRSPNPERPSFLKHVRPCASSTTIRWRTSSTGLRMVIPPASGSTYAPRST